jgi:hypothetical protein
MASKRRSIAAISNRSFVQAGGKSGFRNQVTLANQPLRTIIALDPIDNFARTLSRGRLAIAQ